VRRCCPTIDVFDAAYSAARESRDLAALFAMLEQWRRIAVLQADRDNFRWVVGRVVELRTSESVAANEPLAVRCTNAGL
jgi:Family of unknown function (DUF6247)